MGGQAGGIPIGQLVLALYQIGISLKKDVITKLVEEAGVDPNTSSHVDESQLALILAIHRRHRLLKWRQSCGFKPEEVQHIHDAIGTPDASVALAEVLSVLDRLGRAPASVDLRD